MTPFIDFAGMSEREAQAFLESWVATSDERIVWLRERAEAELPLRRDGFLDAWGAYLRWWDAGGADERGGPLPMWWRDPVATEPLAAPALWWVDAIAHYWGAVALAEFPQLEWRRHPSPPGITVHTHNYPTLMVRGEAGGFNMDSIGTVYGGAVRAKERTPAPFGRVHASCEPEALLEVYTLNVRYIEGPG